MKSVPTPIRIVSTSSHTYGELVEQYDGDCFAVQLGESGEWEIRVRKNGEGLEIRNRDGERVHVTMDASNSVRLQLAQHFAREYCEVTLDEIEIRRRDVLAEIERERKRR